MLPSKHQNNLGVAVGAERDNCYFFIMSGRKEPLVYLPHNFQEFNQGVRALLMDGLMTHALFMRKFFWYLQCPECQISFLRGECHHVMSYLCSWSKADAAYILPAEIVCSGNGAEVPKANQVKVYHVPSELRGKCSKEAVEIGNKFIQIGERRVSASCWLDGVSNFHSVGD